MRRTNHEAEPKAAPTAPAPIARIVATVVTVAIAALGAVSGAVGAQPPVARAVVQQGPASGPRAELQKKIDQAENQLVALASAVPAAKFSWRPAPGVRSFGEVCLHVAGGNYEVGSFFGLKPPAGLNLEKIEQQGADKGNSIAAMRVSFQRVRDAIAAMSDADLDRKIDLFGSPGTVRLALIDIVAHAHEHLGQLIAYARFNGIVPPWTAAEQAAAAKKH